MTDQNNLNVSMQSPNRTKSVVMSRVRTIHTLQSPITTAALSMGVFVVALWGIGREVWVSRVFQNEPSLTNVSALLHFYLAAFLDTRFIVQVLAVIAIASLVWLVYNLFRTVRQGSLRYA